MIQAATSAWTRIPVGIEEGPDGSAHVHALTLPGCVASGTSKDAALETFVTALGSWLAFLAKTGQTVPSRERELEIAVDEWITTDADIASGDTTVCFEADRIPIAKPEMLRGLHLLGALRARLLSHVRRARNEHLETLGDPVLNVRRILDELARAQWWTLTRLGSSPLAEVPAQVVTRLDTSMALIVQRLSQIGDDTDANSLILDGEEWTQRKVLRRLLWLEWSLGGAAIRAFENSGSPAVRAMDSSR